MGRSECEWGVLGIKADASGIETLTRNWGCQTSTSAANGQSWLMKEPLVITAPWLITASLLITTAPTEHYTLALHAPPPNTSAPANYDAPPMHEPLAETPTLLMNSPLQITSVVYYFSHLVMLTPSSH